MLTGTIPDMSNLTDLVLLDLSENQLRGTLPAYWAAGNSLAYFAVQSNQLTGTIPVTHIANRYLGLPHTPPSPSPAPPPFLSNGAVACIRRC